MPVFLHSLILSIACGLLFGCADLPLPPEVAFAPQTPPSSMPPDPQAEPKVWGVLSRLVGRKFDPPQSGFPGFEFVWSKPGQEMQEIFAYHHGESFGDPERHRRTIRPGALPGQLVATFDSLSFVGTVEADGSVYFKGQDIYGYRFRLNSKGELLFENVGMTPEGKLNAVYFSTPYPVVGMSIANSIAATPLNQPQVVALDSTQQSTAGQPVLAAGNAVKTKSEVLSSQTSQSLATQMISAQPSNPTTSSVQTVQAAAKATEAEELNTGDASSMALAGCVPQPQAPEGIKNLEFGEKYSECINDQSLKSSILRIRYDLFKLPARKGEEVFITIECETVEANQCYWSYAALNKSALASWTDLYETGRKKKGYRLILEEDNEVIKVTTGTANSNFNYSIFVEKGDKGRAIWNSDVAEWKAYNEEKARLEREADRQDSANNAQLFGAVMQGLTQGVAEGAADYQNSVDQHNALMQNIGNQANIIQQQQQAREEAEARAQAEAAAQEASATTAREQQQDATVAAAIAQARQLASDVGADAATISQLDGLQLEAEKRKQEALTPAPANTPPKQQPFEPPFIASPKTGSGPEPANCKERLYKSYKDTAWHKSEADARSRLNVIIGTACGNKGPAKLLGEPTCNWTDKKLGPEEDIVWTCGVEFTCGQILKDCGPAQGSAQ